MVTKFKVDSASPGMLPVFILALKLPLLVKQYSVHLPKGLGYRYSAHHTLRPHCSSTSVTLMRLFLLTNEWREVGVETLRLSKG